MLLTTHHMMSRSIKYLPLLKNAGVMQIVKQEE